MPIITRPDTARTTTGSSVLPHRRVRYGFLPALALLAMPAHAAMPADAYEAGQSYAGGSRVCYQQDLFRAQWWAGPNDSPASAYTAANSWDNPWVLESPDACTSGTGNTAPVADATANPPEIFGAGSIALDGSLSTDPDGDPMQFAWAQVAPVTPTASIHTADASSTQVDLPAVTTDTLYEFRLSVSDGEHTDYTTVQILQRAGQVSPPEPTAVISAPGTAACPGSITLSAESSTIPEETGYVLTWRQRNGPAAVLLSPNSTTTQVDFPDTGVNASYTFELEISNGEQSSTATVTIAQQCDQSGYPIARSTLEARETELTSSPLFSQVKASIVTLENSQVEAVAPGRIANPPNVQRVEFIVASADWDFLFPVRAAEYSYTNFLRAVAKFPAFCGDYSDGRNAEDICRKSLATMFAHFTQETGGHTSHWAEPEWRQGLYFIREQGWNENTPNGYGICAPSTWQAQQWPCATFADGSYKSYFGRGAKQLSYNYNYGPFSAAMFGDVNVLLEQPNLVADTWLNLASAVFFFVYPQPPKPSMLHVIDGTWQPNSHDLSSGLVPGFGVTTMVINGGIECGGSNEHAQSQNRIDYYRHFANHLSVEIPASEVLGCASMDRFAVGGAGAMEIYWEQDWSWDPQYPNGESYACKLVGYQTRFSAFIGGDYVHCVEHFFDVHVDHTQ
ncbi:glycoside hydrolase family 19 protein [uncultured Microbulbifer sp.]|uniref:glycoside hydrolase family 19 protein n=1 Tax=uncultured Microbulbifer sp. TaxID=348147 RepID=UPI00262ED0E6|nr:glycoside hydrolase family 19 protein [uncultured Microbulbifer sp.]